MGVALSITSFLTSTYANNQALIAQGRANQQTARNYLKTMNYSFQNLEQERLDTFESTVSDLEKTKLQGNRMEGMVNAAVNESLEGGGRTADLLKRGASADTARATGSIKDNYRKKMNEIDLNKEASLLNAVSGIKSIQDVQKPSLLGTLVGLAGAYYQGKTTDDSIRAIRNKAGVGSAYSTVQPYKVHTIDWNAMFGKPDTMQFDFTYKNPFDRWPSYKNTTMTSYF